MGKQPMENMRSWLGGLAALLVGQCAVGNAQPAAIVLSASSGVLSGPVAIREDCLQASRTTNFAQCGRAVYSFVLTNGGDFVLRALVATPTNRPGALYVNIDAEPVEPGTLWSIPPAAGFTNRFMAWQGDRESQNRTVFRLGPGPHALVVRSKEPDVRLQSVSILRLPGPPRITTVSSGP